MLATRWSSSSSAASPLSLYQAPIPPTQDIDITPRLSPPNLARLSSALDELGARIRTQGVEEGLAFSHDAESLARASIWNLTTTAGDFDLSFRPSGTDGYDDLATNAVVIDVAGHQVEVAALADVVRSKTAAGRPKDHATLDTLRQWVNSLKGVSSQDVRGRMHEVLRLRSTVAPRPDDGHTPPRVDRSDPSSPQPDSPPPADPTRHLDEPPQVRSPPR